MAIDLLKSEFQKILYYDIKSGQLQKGVIRISPEIDEDLEIINESEIFENGATETQEESPKIERFIAENRLTVEGLCLAGHFLTSKEMNPKKVLKSFRSKLLPELNAEILEIDIESKNFPENFADFSQKSLPDAFQKSIFKISSIVLPTALRKITNTLLVEPLDLAVTQWIRYLRAKDEKFFEFEKFEQSFQNEIFLKSEQKLPEIFNDLYLTFAQNARENRICEVEIFVKLYSLVKESLHLLFCLQVFYEGAKSQGANLLAKIEENRRVVEVVASRNLEYRREVSRLDFEFWAKGEFDKLIPDTDLLDICSRLGQKSWSDTGDLLNHYWVLGFSSTDLKMKIHPDYTHISMIEEKGKEKKGKIWILHRRSHDLDKDPLIEKKSTWNNWHRDDMKTIDFAVRDELTSIDVLGISREDLLQKSHEKAIQAATGCKTIITSGHSKDLSFCSFGDHPNAAGRVIRVFGQISVFIGF